jgi:hypothetical protein
MLRCQKIGLWRNFMWTFRKILKFKIGVSKYAYTRVSAAGISYSSVYRVVNGKSPPESNRPKERKLLMILTVALLNGPFIECTTGKWIKWSSPGLLKLKKLE